MYKNIILLTLISSSFSKPITTHGINIQNCLGDLVRYWNNDNKFEISDKMSDNIGKHINPHVNSILCETLDYAKALKPKEENKNTKLQETYDVLSYDDSLLDNKKLLDIDASIDEINDVSISCEFLEVDPCKVLTSPINSLIRGLNIIIRGINSLLDGVDNVCTFVTNFVEDPNMFSDFVDEVNDVIDDIGANLIPSVVDEDLVQQNPTCNVGTEICSQVDPRYENGDGYKALITPLFLPSPMLVIADLIGNIINDENVDESVLDENKPLTDIKCYSKTNVAAQLQLIHYIIVIVDNAVDKVCEILPELADIPCWVITLVTSNIEIISEARLTSIDFHDAAVANSQRQALFEDRERIIGNQKVLENLNINNYNNITDLVNSQFNTLTNHLDIQFSANNVKNQQRFESLFLWIDKKFDDIFDNINTIVKLIETPAGRRPNWNTYTDENELLLKESNITEPNFD